jgi:hypothetical protein
MVAALVRALDRHGWHPAVTADTAPAVAPGMPAYPSDTLGRSAP